MWQIRQKKAGMGVGEYTSLCTNQIPCKFFCCEIVFSYFPISSVCSDWCYTPEINFSLPLRNSVSDAVLQLSTTVFKSGKEGQKELTELAKCLDSAVCNNGNSKEMCTELFFCALVLDQYSLLTNQQVWIIKICIGKEKNVIRTSLLWIALPGFYIYTGVCPRLYFCLLSDTASEGRLTVVQLGPPSPRPCCLNRPGRRVRGTLNPRWAGCVRRASLSLYLSLCLQSMLALN